MKKLLLDKAHVPGIRSFEVYRREGGYRSVEKAFKMAPADMKDKIMHATFKAGDLTIMVSDCMPGQPLVAGTNVSLSLNFNDIDGIEKTFAALSEGSTITMPLQDTFWGARFGMLTDKFGFHWMFNHDIKKPEGK